MDPQLPPPPPRQILQSQWYLIAVILALTLAGILYRQLVSHDLNHTGLMFLGLPAIIAIVLALTPKAKSVTGGILKGMTLALLVLAPILQEGMICILIASPLYYLVGIVVGLIVDHQRRKSVTLSCIAVVLLPLCLEGTTPSLTFPRDETASVTRTLPFSSAQVAAALAQSPHLATPLPAVLRIGYPVPLAAYGSGAAVGDTRTIHFSGAEHKPPGDIVVRITASTPGHLASEVTRNETKLASWLQWTSSEVDWHSVDPTHTTVTWTMHYQRQLDPAWYFVPLQRAAVRQAAAYMIQSNATPQP